jgi:hypothetical protein
MVENSDTDPSLKVIYHVRRDAQYHIMVKKNLNHIFFDVNYLPNYRYNARYLSVIIIINLLI